MPKSKVFVIDTNVILHDHECIYHFNDNDVILPITVLEELDRFKRGNDQINFQARQFVRVLDEIVGDELFNGGISLGTDKGKLTIETDKPFSEKLKESFREDIAQHSTYEQILLARPIVALSNRDIGFLPGDAEEKVSPYMQPLIDNLAVIKRCFNQNSACLLYTSDAADD